LVETHVPEFIAQDPEKAFSEGARRFGEAQERPRHEFSGLKLMVPELVHQAAACVLVP
jgi:hypothetical protein